MSDIAATPPVRLSELVGPENVLAETATLAAYQVDGCGPSAVVRPGSAAEIADIVHFAAAENLTVIPMGGRTKLAIGMPPPKYDLALDLSRMNRVLAYDPRDLTLGVEPGVRFTDLERLLAAEGQFLPLAPACADRATLGGMAAANADTPLRYGFGSMRDHVLGMEFVTGTGALAKSGGRVVKNVSGYDMHKLLIGSLGTLAVITRLNLRTSPVAPAEQMFLASFEDAAAALEFCAAIGRSQLQPRVLDALSPAAADLVVSEHASPSPWIVAVLAAGPGAAVDRHRRELEGMARRERATDCSVVPGSARPALFARLRDWSANLPAAFPGAAMFRIAAQPSATATLLDQVRVVAQRNALDHAILVRGGGIVYAALCPPRGEAGAIERVSAACGELMRAALDAGAQPMIESCPPDVKRSLSVWPEPGSEREIAKRLKKVFDPHGILSPGRFRGGI
jgi:glycolate oxidase FAD binding subunit